MDEHFSFYEEKAKRILSDCTYMVVGTSSRGGKPWVATVLFVHDEDYNIYFLSAVDALHSKNIIENPAVSIAVFDSRQRIGLSDGVQGEGTAALVEKADIKKVITLYCKKVFPDSEIAPTSRYKPEDYLGAAEFRFFRIKLSGAYVTGEERRVKVELGK